MKDVVSKIKEFGELYKQGNYQLCYHEIVTYWDSLPEPKESIQHSYLIVEYGARISLILKNFEYAMKWALIGLNYNEIRSDIGQSEFLIGKVAFEKGDLDLAKKYFLIADQKSEGKAFHGENPHYKKLIK